MTELLTIVAIGILAWGAYHDRRAPALEDEWDAFLQELLA